MAHDSVIARLVPQYAGTGAPADAADLSEIAVYAGNYGNYAVESSTTRLARTGTSLWYGLQVTESDTGLTWQYTTSWANFGISPWITYTPTISNLTLAGGATSSFLYRYEGPTEITVSWSMIFGTSGFPTGAVAFTLPVNAMAVPTTQFYVYRGSATGFDTSATATSPGYVRANGTSVSTVQVIMTPTGTPSTVTATTPWTWAVGDGLGGEFTYRTA